VQSNYADKQAISAKLTGTGTTFNTTGCGLPAVRFFKGSNNTPENPVQRIAEGKGPQKNNTNAFQLKTGGENRPAQKRANKTGLPDNLKTGIENLSGFSMDDTKVHYNSAKPAQLNALAYAQGTDIHIAHSQEKHLAHEAWHVVQQKQGRVKPTLQTKTGINMNDDAGLEKEADRMGARALQLHAVNKAGTNKGVELISAANMSPVIQGMIIRIRDIKEMLHIGKPTIMDASKSTKLDMGGAAAAEKEDYGITEATAEDARKLGSNEELRVVAHGSEPTYEGIISSGIPALGGHKPGDLAAKLSTVFPANYKGLIYLDGCYTALRLDYKAGTSYIELFAQALKVLRPDIKSAVRGNIGPAATSSATGQEIITLTQELASLAANLGWPVETVANGKTGKIEFKVLAPFGTAFCDGSGTYDDMGLTTHVTKQRQEALERQKREDALSRLKPEQLQTLDPIWNDIL